MRVLNVIYNKGQGGLEDMYLKYSEMLTNTGNEVIAMLPFNSMIEVKVRKLDIPVILNKDISNSISHINPLSVHRVKKIIINIKPDIIIVHNSRPVRLLNKAARDICPVVVVHHGGSTKRLLDNAEHIICVSEHITRELKKVNSQNRHIHYISNSIDITKKYISNKKDKSPLIIGVMARFTHEKGVDIFIDSLKHIDVPYKAIIAGDGELKDNFKEMVSKHNLNIEFLGWLDNQDKDIFFERCNIIVVPSRSEHFGLVILEAWMHSVPVISSKTNGGLELVNHGIDGLLFDLENPKMLAREIISIANDTSLMSEITKNAYDKLTKYYSSSELEKKLAKILDDIINFDYKVHEDNASHNQKRDNAKT